jgi:hypothetical protein
MPAAPQAPGNAIGYKKWLGINSNNAFVVSCLSQAKKELERSPEPHEYTQPALELFEIFRS